MINYNLKKAFKDLQKTTIRNIANDIIQYIFHKEASDEELEAYYGGGVDREAMLIDTVKRFESDKLILNFINNNKNTIKAYAKNKIGDINLIEERTTGEVIDERSGASNDEEDSQGEPKESNGEEVQ